MLKRFRKAAFYVYKMLAGLTDHKEISDFHILSANYGQKSLSWNSSAPGYFYRLCPMAIFIHVVIVF